MYRSTLLATVTLALMACGGTDASQPDTTAPDTDRTPTEAEIGESTTEDPDAGRLPATSDLGLPTTQIREAGKLYPVDEAPRDPEFVAFRQNLLATVARRDVAGLTAIVHPEIHFSFGAEHGRANFSQEWGLIGMKAAQSQLWTTLEDVLRGGGTWGTDRTGGERLFVAPYTFATYRGEDAFTEAVITGEGVRARAEPDLQADIVTLLSHDVVAVVAGGRPIAETEIGGRRYGWTQVRVPGGQTAFVSDKFVARPIGYRAMFEPIDGRWMMTVFIAGD